MAMLTESMDEIDLVDLASHLRQLLFDKRSLVDTVNDGVKLRFEVGTFGPGWGPDDDPHWEKVVYQSLQDGIDPQSPPYSRSVTLTANQFGQHTIAFSQGEKITIKDMIRYNANRRGGRHWDPTSKQEYVKLQRLESLYVGGIAAPTRELKAIGRVVLRSLDPLITHVKTRVS